MNGLYLQWAIPEKVQAGGGGLRIYFSENPPGIFRFVTLPLEISEKTSFHSWKFCKIM